MSPADAAAPAANVLLTEIGAFTLTVLAGVIVSLVTLWLAGADRNYNRCLSRLRQVLAGLCGRWIGCRNVVNPW